VYRGGEDFCIEGYYLRSYGVQSATSSSTPNFSSRLLRAELLVLVGINDSWKVSFMVENPFPDIVQGRPMDICTELIEAIAQVKDGSGNVVA